MYDVKTRLVRFPFPVLRFTGHIRPRSFSFSQKELLIKKARNRAGDESQHKLHQIRSGSASMFDDGIGAVEPLVHAAVLVAPERHCHLVADRRVSQRRHLRGVSAVDPAL